MHTKSTLVLLVFVLSLLLLTGLGLIFTHFAQANANFTVNITADTHDANPGDGSCADSNDDCSLRAAIEEGNAAIGEDLIELPASDLASKKWTVK